MSSGMRPMPEMETSVPQWRIAAGNWLASRYGIVPVAVTGFSDGHDRHLCDVRGVRVDFPCVLTSGRVSAQAPTGVIVIVFEQRRYEA